MSFETVVLDACVLYPAPIRDLLLNLADQNLYAPKWSTEIEKEWVNNLLSNRPDLSPEKLARTVELMNKAFPEAKVVDYNNLIERLVLPDEKDRHVLAIGIKSRSSTIVTFNLKDFPKLNLNEYNIIAIHPDDFIISLSERNIETVKKSFDNQLASLKNPPKTRSELIQTLEKCGLHKSLEIFKKKMMK